MTAALPEPGAHRAGVAHRRRGRCARPAIARGTGEQTHASSCSTSSRRRTSSSRRSRPRTTRSSSRARRRARCSSTPTSRPRGAVHARGRRRAHARQDGLAIRVFGDVVADTADALATWDAVKAVEGGPHERARGARACPPSRSRRSCRAGREVGVAVAQRRAKAPAEDGSATRCWPVAGARRGPGRRAGPARRDPPPAAGRPRRRVRVLRPLTPLVPRLSSARAPAPPRPAELPQMVAMARS